MNSIEDLEKKINITFNDKSYLKLALTHKSYSIENNSENNLNNERLEFLGDSVLSIIVSTYLYLKYPFSQEGDLSKYRAKIVSKEYCYYWAEKLDLGSFLFLGKGEEKSKGRERISNLANSFEAVLGSLYLDQGLEVTRKFLLDYLELEIIDISELKDDYKSKLQEILQKIYKYTPIYTVVSESGPAHNKTFKIEVKIADKVIGYGQGNSKKQAEQLAAQDALFNKKYIELEKVELDGTK
jgi:ribonuclease-3